MTENEVEQSASRGASIEGLRKWLVERMPPTAATTRTFRDLFEEEARWFQARAEAEAELARKQAAAGQRRKESAGQQGNTEEDQQDSKEQDQGASEEEGKREKAAMDRTLLVRKGSGGETWVARTSRDRFGIALSGGGVRSATFNLGLLQALARGGVLKHLDYLSTVSGGGYIGGFWTAWLRRHRARPGDARFPLGEDERGGEPPEIRHLREFSRFLLPRVGLLETSFWHVVMTVLGGLLPSFAAAASVLVLVWCLWLAGLFLFASQPALVAALALAALVAMYLAVSEWRWTASSASEDQGRERVGYFTGSFLSVAALVGLSQYAPGVMGVGACASVPPLDDCASFTPGALMAGSVGLLLVLRLLVVRVVALVGGVPTIAGFERAVSRLIGPTLMLLGIALLWSVTAVAQGDVALPAASAVSSTALFVLVRKWLAEPIKDTRGARLGNAVLGWLRRSTPKVLATVSLLLIFLLFGVGLRMWTASNGGNTVLALLWPVVVALAIVVFCLLTFDPARVGLHEFYRSRIARCYLGASNPDGLEGVQGEYERARRNRFLDERSGDDVTLGKLAAPQLIGPIHLVCTAANDMSGDRVGTLYRGARSAVLSMHGVTVGDVNAPLDDLRLSSALTASAAAFNSQMGRMSVDFGPAVTFLMSALNLRLGLWVPHPANRSRGRSFLPGRMFFAELLGQSSADGAHLHLSDGNHFENFGLYELVRRHCRYIIVADCGQDEDVAFDDLANVLRRIREDFNVEIELDVSQLRPGANGMARQHAVVGTIHYNGPNAADKGTILYVKPVLTGDEPADVMQYRTRNTAFPNESTGDQFFDEAQWESYRRLGEHVGRNVFSFLDAEEIKNTSPVDQLFRGLRSHWYSTPTPLEASSTALAARCDELERDLFDTGPVVLRREFLPEAAVSPAPKAAAAAADAQGDQAVLAFVLRATRLLEEIWRARMLESLWFHPVNQGWMNYCERWAATPSFRRWWPLVAPLVDAGFREFVKARFRIGVVDAQARPGAERKIAGANASLIADAAPLWVTASDAWRQFSARSVVPATLLRKSKVHAYELRLHGDAGGGDSRGLLIGFAIVTERRVDRQRALAKLRHDEDEADIPVMRVLWHAPHLFVVPSLHGSGIVSRLLDAVISRYARRAAASRKPIELIVMCRATPGRNAAAQGRGRRLDRGQRYQLESDIEFYKSRGFLQDKPDVASLRRLLRPDASAG